MTRPVLGQEPGQRCRYCGASIRWHRTRDNKWMPVDEKPSTEGNLVMIRSRWETRVEVVDLFTAADAERFIPHWATCPRADEVRRDTTGERT